MRFLRNIWIGISEWPGFVRLTRRAGRLDHGVALVLQAGEKKVSFLNLGAMVAGGGFELHARSHFM